LLFFSILGSSLKRIRSIKIVLVKIKLNVPKVKLWSSQREGEPRRRVCGVVGRK
jgi:hypothetical protein